MYSRTSEVVSLDCSALEEQRMTKKILNNETVKYTDNVDCVYSIDDAVNRAGYGKFQLILTTLAGLGWLADAFEIIILSLIGNYVACEWPIKRWQNATLTSVGSLLREKNSVNIRQSVFIGMMIGSPVFGSVADIYGRKKSLAFSMTLIFLFGALSAASPSYTWMVIFRTLTGFALGGVAQGLTLCCEYFPSNVRGKAGFYLCYFWSAGTMGVILLAWFIMEYFDSWRTLLLATSVPALLVVLSLKWYPESARYYLVSNQHLRAQKLLTKMAYLNGKDLPPGNLVHVSPSFKRGRICDLLSKDLRRSTILFWYIWLAVAFSYYGVALISPIIIQRGTLAVDISNSNETDFNFFDNMKEYVPCTKFTQRNYIDLLWTSAAEFPGLVIFTFLIEHCNRKVLLSASCAITAVLTFLLLLQTSHIIILLCLFGARAISVAVFQLIYVMTSESFPTTLRAIALGSGSAFCRLGGLVVPYVAQILVIQSPVFAICLLAGVILLAVVAAAYLPIETRGRNMEELHSSKG